MYIIIGAVVLVGLILCFCLAVASFSSDNFYEKLIENRQRSNSCGISTLDYVKAINSHFFDGRLKLALCEQYQDHYSTGVVALSEETMSSDSLASLATVSHELGHAKQDAEGDKLKKHWRRKKIGRICGLFFMPSVIIGVVLSVLYLLGILPQVAVLATGLGFLGLGVFIFIFAVYLKYREIKIEKEASKYAMEYLRELLTPQESKACEEFLDSARLTYWAILFKTLLGWTFLTGKDKMFR